MKKVLFATSALVATAGIAAADVAVTGGAEMGIVSASSGSPADFAGDTVFHQSADVRFTMTGETDGGLNFGATIDLNDSAEQGDSVDIQGNFADFTVFISGDFGTLTMGDTDGAFDFALTEVNAGSPGSIDDAETGHRGYSGNSGLDGFGNMDGQVLRYNYSISDFTIAVSAEVDDSPADGVIYGIGASYAFGFSGGTLTVGAGYQVADEYTAATDDADAVGVSASVALDSGLTATINYSMFDVNGFEGVHTAIGASYAFDMITVHANYGHFDWDVGSGLSDSEGFGLAAAYDLGGGLSAHFAYGYSDVTALNGSGDTLGDYSQYSLGLAMSF